MHKILADALAFLDQNEAKWKLKRPIGRRSYLRGVVRDIADAKLRKQLREEIASLSDDELTRTRSS